LLAIARDVVADDGGWPRISGSRASMISMWRRVDFAVDRDRFAADVVGE
jgi:hypothetical protein